MGRVADTGLILVVDDNADTNEVLRAMHSCAVRKGGLEPPRVFSPQDPESCASANSATFAWASSYRQPSDHTRHSGQAANAAEPARAVPFVTCRALTQRHRGYVFVVQVLLTHSTL